jgi:hypothetical protein
MALSLCRSRATQLLGLAAGLVLMLPGTTLAQEPGEGGGPTTSAVPASEVNTLAPIGEVLSGRPWLITEGLDPTFSRPGGGEGEGGERDNAAGAGGGGIQQGGGVLVPFRNPGPAFSANRLITRDYSQAPFQTEPSLAVDPADPDHLVLGEIDYNFPSVASYVSLDGGETWDGPFQSPYVKDDLGAGGDPGLVFDRAGNVYMSTISIGVEEFDVGPTSVESLVSSIAVSTSANGGYDWPVTVSGARSEVSTEGLSNDQFGRLRGELSIGFLDKPWIAVGPNTSDPTKDSLYVTYTDFEVKYQVLWLSEIPVLSPVETDTTIQMVRSDDGAKTWSKPVAVSPTVTQTYGGEGGSEGEPGVLSSKRTVQGSQPAVTPDGTVYVTWVDSLDDEAMKGKGAVMVASSTDGGKTFGKPVTASEFDEIGFSPRNSFFRYWGSEFPQLAVGPKGEVYVTWVGKPHDRVRDDGDVFLVSSTDDGKTWTKAKRLNDDQADATQFFPSITVGPDGRVHVMWGDMRDDTAGTRYQIYYTESQDAGKTWGFDDPQLNIHSGDTRVTDFGSNPNRGFPAGRFLGDYFSIKAGGDEVYLVWADTRLGEYGAPNQKIAFARRKAVQAPSLFVSPPSGPGGQAVTIQGNGFQPDLGVFVQLGDQTIAVKRTDRDGNFQANVYMPVTSQGPQTLTVADESGNVATSSYFTEFGIGDIKSQYDDLVQRLEELQRQLAGQSPGATPGPGESATPGASSGPGSSGSPQP